MAESTRTIMGSISATYERCKEENIGISKSQIRYLVSNNVIPSVKIGTKYLVNYNVLMGYLNRGIVKPEEEPKAAEKSHPVKTISTRRIRPVC